MRGFFARSRFLRGRHRRHHGTGGTGPARAAAGPARRHRRWGRWRLQHRGRALARGRGRAWRCSPRRCPRRCAAASEIDQGWAPVRQMRFVELEANEVSAADRLMVVHGVAGGDPGADAVGRRLHNIHVYQQCARPVALPGRPARAATCWRGRSIIRRSCLRFPLGAAAVAAGDDAHLDGLSVRVVRGIFYAWARKIRRPRRRAPRAGDVLRAAAAAVSVRVRARARQHRHDQRGVLHAGRVPVRARPSWFAGMAAGLAAGFKLSRSSRSSR